MFLGDQLGPTGLIQRIKGVVIDSMTRRAILPDNLPHRPFGPFDLWPGRTILPNQWESYQNSYRKKMAHRTRETGASCSIRTRLAFLPDVPPRRILEYLQCRTCGAMRAAYLRCAPCSPEIRCGGSPGTC